jgi:protein O-mannosyl-transferase
MAKKQHVATSPAGTVATPTPNTHWSHWQVWLPVAAGFVLSAISLGYPLLGIDDHASTIQNPIVRDFFNPTHWSKFNLGMYAPVTWAAYALAYTLSGGKDAGFWYHLLSVVVHTLNVWLVIRMLVRLEVSASVRWVVALLFAIHPIQVESIAWVAGFSTPFYVFFSLISINFYLRYAHESSKRSQWYALALGVFVVACLAKSAAVALPPTLVILDWWRRPEQLSMRQRVLGYLPFFAVAVAFGLLTIYSRNASGTQVGASSEYSALERLLLVCYTPLLYLGKMLAPTHLNIYYSYNKINGQLPWMYYAAPLGVLALSVAAWYLRHRARYVYLGLLFFLANVFVTLPFATLGVFELCADHYNYLACVGVFWALAEGYAALSQHFSKQKNTLRLVAGVWLLAMVLLSVRQIRFWKDTVSIISQAIDNGFYHRGMMFVGRGIEYGDLKKPQLAIQDFSRAIELDSTIGDAYKFRGSLYAQSGRTDLGIRDLEKYIAINPTDTATWNNLGEVYLMQNRLPAALNAFTRVVELNPRGVHVAYQKRAIVLEKMGDTTRAQADQAKARELALSRKK